MKLYKALANLITARIHCINSKNDDWMIKHEKSIFSIMEKAPNGSGIDTGTKIDLEKSNPNKLVFYFSYHFMNDNGYYDGWGDYTVIAKPDFISDFDLFIVGKNRNDIKEYLYQVFESWLSDENGE